MNHTIAVNLYLQLLRTEQLLSTLPLQQSLITVDLYSRFFHVFIVAHAVSLILS